MKYISIFNEMSPYNFKQSNRWYNIKVNELDKYDFEELYDEFNISYKKNKIYNTKEDMIADIIHDNVFLINLKTQKNIGAYILYKDTHCGKKLYLIGFDGSNTALKYYSLQLKKILMEKGYYIEASDRIYDFLSKFLKPITDENVVKFVLKGKEITWLENGKYKRIIKGLGFIEKVLFGNPLV